MIKIKSFFIILFIFSLVSAYEFCDPTYYVFLFGSSGNIEDIQRYNEIISSNPSLLSYDGLLRELNTSKSECEKYLENEELRKKWIESGILVNEVDCGRGFIPLNDSAEIYFNDYFISIQMSQSGCINSTTFPYPTEHGGLLNKAWTIGNNLGVYPGDYLFVTKIKNNPFGITLNYPQGIFEQYTTDSQFFQTIFNETHQTPIEPKAYYSKYKDLDTIWVFDQSEHNKIVIFGIDYTVFRTGSYNGQFGLLLEMETTKILTSFALSELEQTNNDLYSIETKISTIEAEYLLSNTTTGLFAILSDLKNNESARKGLNKESDDLEIIKKQTAYQKTLFESEEYPSALRFFVYSKLATSAIAVESQTELIEKKINALDGKIIVLTQNIQDKIQLITTEEKMQETIDQQRTLTENMINQQWIIIAIFIIMTLGIEALKDLPKVVDTKKSLFSSYFELKKIYDREQKESEKLLKEIELEDTYEIIDNFERDTKLNLFCDANFPEIKLYAKEHNYLFNSDVFKVELNKKMSKLESEGIKIDKKNKNARPRLSDAIITLGDILYKPLFLGKTKKERLEENYEKLRELENEMETVKIHHNSIQFPDKAIYLTYVMFLASFLILGAGFAIGDSLSGPVIIISLTMLGLFLFLISQNFLVIRKKI